MKFENADLAKLLPHGAAMCLIDNVLDHNEHGLKCQTEQHQASNCVLLRNGRISLFAAVEMAAQAAALHAARQIVEGSLESVAPMVLGAIRGLEYERDDLNLRELAEPLMVDVQLQHANDATAIYAFSLTAGNMVLMAGRMTLLRTDIAPEISPQ